jgi:hypothetical protein
MRMGCIIIQVDGDDEMWVVVLCYAFIGERKPRLACWGLLCSRP